MIQAAKIIRTGLAITGLIGACVGIGVVFGALIIGVSRNPSLRGQLFSYAILRFAFSEVTGLFASMMAFLSRNVSIGIRLAANILSGHMLPGNPHNFNSFRKVSAAVSGLSSAIIPYLGYTIVVMLYSRGININATNIDLELLGLVNPTQTQMGSVIDSISNNITIIISLFPIMSVAMGITGGINILLGLNHDLMINLLHMALLDLTTYLELTLANLERVFASDDSGFYAQRLYQIRRDAYLLRFVYHGLLFFASFRGSGLGTLEIGGFAITRITDRVNQLLSDLGIE